MPEGVTETVAAVAELLREAADLHHRTYRLTDGADDDWASFYSDWLVNLSELGAVLGRTPVRSEVTWLLVQADKDLQTNPSDDWATAYATAIVAHYGA